ncbi:MAG: tRNA lysidine(34) synthetase TilS, partial [Saprospiraceae bacterium]
GELFHRAQLPFPIAHCNFQLRGAASDGAEFFVKRLAEKWNVPFHTKRFATKAAAEQPQQSLQMVARELRFDWFDKLTQQSDYQHIATAHHANDSIETAMYNFAKGCGLRGLRGILPKQNNVIHPLLFATKAEILAFAKAEQIAFREDVSNASDKYARNFIRHHLLPLFNQLNPNFSQTGKENMQRLRQSELIYKKGLQAAAIEVGVTHFDQKNKDGEFVEWRRTLNTKELAEHPAAETILYEQFKNEGFSTPQIRQILTAVHRPQGQLFESATHRILVLKSKIIIEPQPIDNQNIKLEINNKNQVVTFGAEQWESFILEEIPTDLKTKRNEVLLDYDLLQFPLTLRRYRSGDSFQPFGLNGKSQTIKKYCKDHQIDRFHRERLWLLCSGEEICWLVDQRADERFKVTKKTRKILHFKYQIIH